MNDNDQTQFNRLYKQHTNELKLQGKSERTIEMYSRTLRKITAQNSTITIRTRSE